MQEAVEQGTIRFAVTTASLSGFALLKGCQVYLEMRRKGKIKHGYMTVDELIKKDQGVSTVDVAKDKILDFANIAEKYGVDYAARYIQDPAGPRYIVFFKAKDKDAYRQYGINCIENGSYDDAVDAFQKALDQSVGSVGAEELDICYYKAKAQYLSGDVDGAIDTYTAIIDYNKDSDAYYLRGCIYFAKNDSDKGMRDFKTALSENDDNYELYLGVYETLSKYGMNDQGKEYLDKALKFKAKTADDYMQRGRIYTMLGDYDSAIKSLQKAIDEKLVKANYYMGEVYQKQGDNDSSQKYFKKYLDSGEADSYDLMNMGQAQMDNGNYDTAITYFQNALELESVPNKQQITKAMIIAYEYSGDFATAKSKMEEYMKDYPDDEDATREYQFLETR